MKVDRFYRLSFILTIISEENIFVRKIWSWLAYFLLLHQPFKRFILQILNKRDEVKKELKEPCHEYIRKCFICQMFCFPCRIAVERLGRPCHFNGLSGTYDLY